MEEREFPGGRVKAWFGIALVAIVVIVMLGLSGCGDSSDDSTNGGSSDSTAASKSASSESSSEESTPSEASNEEPPGPEAVTVDELREAAAKQKTPIYWAGERPGTTLAFSPLLPVTEGRAFVRYLTGGAKVDDTRPDFLTVVTYLQPNPAQIQRQLSEGSGSPITETPKGTKVYYDRSQPESIFLVFPGVKAQVEVFAPTDFKEVLQLVNSDGIVPVS